MERYNEPNGRGRWYVTHLTYFGPRECVGVFAESRNAARMIVYRRTKEFMPPNAYMCICARLATMDEIATLDPIVYYAMLAEQEATGD